LTTQHHEIRLGLGQRHRLSKSKRYVCSRQHRAIIEPVSHHGNRAALRLQVPQATEFILWRAASRCQHDSGLLGNPRNRLRTVSGQHLNFYAVATQSRNHCYYFRAQVFAEFESRNPT